MTLITVILSNIFRLHCDNTICCEAFAEYKGCRNAAINEIIKYLISWQLRHQVSLEITYINTTLNQADAPSREIAVEELAVSNVFLRLET